MKRKKFIWLAPKFVKFKALENFYLYGTIEPILHVHVHTRNVHVHVHVHNIIHTCHCASVHFLPLLTCKLLARTTMDILLHNLINT